ncbi:hypothetical protein FN846DRAFT_995469 [Sphaerosporella brunnea]|uniref:Uncharacterized protein n=1 Tax=Sphaerosporella brunnea TaxID=1250544 RepID=A0A5J5EKR4_9PEZI|nr:hypothetical protein FN846DRAFT_995469 [Sphaerosporella brunnea]
MAVQCECYGVIWPDPQDIRFVHDSSRELLYGAVNLRAPPQSHRASLVTPYLELLFTSPIPIHSLHHSITPLLHHSATPSLRHSVTPSVPTHSTPPLHHYPPIPEPSGTMRHDPSTPNQNQTRQRSRPTAVSFFGPEMHSTKTSTSETLTAAASTAAASTAAEMFVKQEEDGDEEMGFDTPTAVTKYDADTARKRVEDSLARRAKETADQKGSSSAQFSTRRPVALRVGEPSGSFFGTRSSQASTAADLRRDDRALFNADRLQRLGRRETASWSPIQDDSATLTSSLPTGTSTNSIELPFNRLEATATQADEAKQMEKTRREKDRFYNRNNDKHRPAKDLSRHGGYVDTTAARSRRYTHSSHRDSVRRHSRHSRHRDSGDEHRRDRRRSRSRSRRPRSRSRSIDRADAKGASWRHRSHRRGSKEDQDYELSSNMNNAPGVLEPMDWMSQGFGSMAMASPAMGAMGRHQQPDFQAGYMPQFNPMGFAMQYGQLGFAPPQHFPPFGFILPGQPRKFPPALPDIAENLKQYVNVSPTLQKREKALYCYHKMLLLIGEKQLQLLAAELVVKTVGHPLQTQHDVQELGEELVNDLHVSIVATGYRDALFLGAKGQRGPKARVLRAYIGAFMQSNRDPDGIFTYIAQKELKMWFEDLFSPRLTAILVRNAKAAKLAADAVASVETPPRVNSHAEDIIQKMVDAKKNKWSE